MRTKNGQDELDEDIIMIMQRRHLLELKILIVPQVKPNIIEQFSGLLVLLHLFCGEAVDELEEWKGCMVREKVDKQMGRGESDAPS